LTNHAADTGKQSSIGILGTSTFDRKKFAEEFRKKLLALPDGYSKRSTLAFPETYKPKKKPFTLPPSFFVEDITTKAPMERSTTREERILRKKSSTRSETKIEPNDQTEVLSAVTAEVEGSLSTELSQTTLNLVAEPKQESLDKLQEVNRPKDLCDEPLNPKLEEDCNNENWESGLHSFEDKKESAGVCSITIQASGAWLACRQPLRAVCLAVEQHVVTNIQFQKESSAHPTSMIHQLLSPHLQASS
ncbi:hypothetical protein GCK32_018058, partial [Trichostrongylus colubriformis]